MEKKNKCNCLNHPQITGFFKDYDLEECGVLLWQLFKLSTAADRSELVDAKEWLNLVSFYESLNELLKNIYMNCTDQ